MIWTTLISLTVIISYIIGVISKFKKIPISISDTYYMTGKKAWFTVAIVIGALMLIPGALEISPNNIQALPFLAGGCMILAGVAPNFKSQEKILHYTGAFGLLGISQLWVMIMEPWLLCTWIILGIWCIWKKLKTWAFWGEIIMMINVYIIVILRLIK